MGTFNTKRNIFFTILGKCLILLLNFAVVVYTTRVWGAEGRGLIALFLANLNLISIVANVFTSSSVSYFLQKTGASKLHSQAALWIFLSSAVAAVVFHWMGDGLALFLFITSILFGFLSFYSSLFVGSQKINYYNWVTVLQPLLLLLCIGIFHFTTGISYFNYFYAQIISLFIVVVIARLLSKKTVGTLAFILDKKVVKKSFRFGFQTELSNLLQFFNYRLGFYFLGYFAGMAPVGVFSIGVTLSESIWIISRSISMVQYSKLLSDGNTVTARKETITCSKYSLYASLACIVVALLLPRQVYIFVFGPEFSEVKKTILLLSPGILAIACSNVYGHYFSAFGHLHILVIKSAIGVVATVLLSLLLIPNLQITGACIATGTAHVVTSFVLLYWFFKKNNDL
ncbi:MAG: polysaccharide biosynthesis C-terminal domain-containing protein [Candidatus Symbiothrix sp.]|jgi:O-antigen/teichoic acid export membrane protein|nr:polysaccharide biosynthesis C-terminal domain-containing protein [Candidatus Symbiothrix sp.]